MTTTEPHYQHDCLHCTFLGSWWRSDFNKYYDLYICPPRNPMSSFGPCLVARASDEGGDYYSFSFDSTEEHRRKAPAMPALKEAYYRARELAFL